MAGTLSAGNILLDAGSNSAPAIAATSSPTVGIVFPAANTIAFSTASVEAMRIDSSGRLGIGITSPTSNLHVVGANIASAIMSSMASSIITAGTTTTPGAVTFIDVTGLPSWVRRIQILYQGISYNSNAIPAVQIGSSGGVVASGYVSAGGDYVPTANHTSATNAFIQSGATSGVGASSNLIHGIATLVHIGSNIWVFSSVLASTGQANTGTGSGYLSLGAVLDRIRLTTQAGTSTFDAGSFNIIYE